MNDFAGHTPGPWEISHSSGGYHHVIHVGLKYIAMTTHTDRYGHDENEANAELIAAAPDLLAERDELLEALQKAKQLATQIQECSIKLDKVYLYADKIKALQEAGDD